MPDERANDPPKSPETPAVAQPSHPLRALHDDETRDALAARAKRELRKRLRAVRSAVPRDALVARSEAICARVLALDAWRTATTIALFLSLDDEVQTALLRERALAEGKRVALPRVVAEQAFLTFREPFALAGEGTALPVERDARFEPSAFGVYEPVAHAPEVPLDAIDLWIIPALAVGPDGHRLGYGRGYYDRTLERARPDALRVAVLFDFQLLAEVPARAGDVPVDLAVTDRRTLDVRAPEAPSNDPPPRPHGRAR